MAEAETVTSSRNGQVTDKRPNPEVVPKAARRRFGAEYKLRVLGEADRCTAWGEIGALLRREGLYSSHLADWRRERDAGQLAALEPKKRGPKLSVSEQQARELAQSQRENERLRERLRQAEAIIDAQKKLAEILGRPLGETPKSERD